MNNYKIDFHAWRKADATRWAHAIALKGYPVTFNQITDSDGSSHRYGYNIFVTIPANSWDEMLAIRSGLIDLDPARIRAFNR